MERASLNFSPACGRQRGEDSNPAPLARASLNSAAPVLKDRFALSRRNCMATRPLSGGGAPLRIESRPSRPLSFVKRTSGKEGSGF
jgi:hypothetical protein